MTRDQYEQHRAGLGSFAELLPPWEMVESSRGMSPLEECKAYLREAMDEGEAYAAAAHRLQGEQRQARSIARALLQETGLTPSQVHSRWPEDAEWLLT